MESRRNPPSSNITDPDSTLHTVGLICLVAALSYLISKLAGVILSHPQTVWPLWPGNAVLVTILLFVPRRVWPFIIPVAFGAFVLYDLEAGIPIGSTWWFIPADTLEVLTAALCLRHFFGGVPRLTSLKALSRYLFFGALLGPFAASFISAFGVHGSYWASWRICFFSEVLAFVTLMPALLAWISDGSVEIRKSRSYLLEFAALIGGVALLGYIAFSASQAAFSPAVLYCLVPLLLWAALRFGSIGISTAVFVLTFLAVWHVVRGAGPFSASGLFGGILSIQIFLVFAAIPFMVLAAVVEQRKQTEEELRENAERFRLATQAGKMFAYEWDAATDVLVRSEESTKILGIDATTPVTGSQLFARVHPDDRDKVKAKIAGLTAEQPFFELSYRMIRPDNTVIWVQRNSRAHFDDKGQILRIVGMVMDITDRKRTEDALRESETWLSMAVRAGRMYAFEWDTATDVILRTGECENIFTWMDDPKRVSGRDFIARMHPDDRYAYDSMLAALSPRNPIYRTSYRLLRPDGSVLWLEANGQAYFDPEGNRLRIIGMVSDITTRKLAEEALASVSRRLIEAQDQERAHIARELHDDLSQRMALLQIGLEQFEQDVTDISAQGRQRLQKVSEVAMEVSSNIHDLSHQLYPSKLDTLGLLPSVSSFCREFGKQYNLKLQFVHRGVTSSISRDVSLCLFRIVQEALRNVIKHSGASEAKVELFFFGDHIELSISDAGSGFSSESAETKTGLGLVSMRERLRLVYGQLTIDSKPSQGTRIHASVPLIATAGVTSEGKADSAHA
jgi:PAS domain S-box-containing protein